MTHLPVISSVTQPAKKMRYATAGDYYETDHGSWRVLLAEMSRWEYEFALLIHELVEMALCKHRKILWEEIDLFDKGEGADLLDPGDSPKAPYHVEHKFAEKIERQIIKAFGLKWKDYAAAFDTLEYQ